MPKTVQLLLSVALTTCGTTALYASTWALPLSTLIEPVPVVGEIGVVPVDRGFSVLPNRNSDAFVFAADGLIRLPTLDPSWPYTVKGVSGNWIWFTYDNSPNQVFAKTLANRIVPMDACDSLVDGAPRIVGNVHCDANALRIYQGARLAHQVSMPPGYRLRDLWPNSHFLLERLSDGLLVSARLDFENRLQLRDVYPVQSSELLERLSANLLPTRFSVGYRIADGYRIFSGESASKLTSNGQFERGHQCFGDITPFVGPTVIVERVSGVRMWREYGALNLVLGREFPLELNDQFFCEQASLGPRPMILRDNGTTQQVLRSNATGFTPIYTSTGGERLHLLGRMLYAHNQDRSWERLQFFDPPNRTPVMNLPDEFPAMAISRLGNQPLRLFRAKRTAADQAEIVVSERSPTSGALLSSTPMPTDIDATGSQQFKVMQVKRPEHWPEGSEVLLLSRIEPGASTAFLLNRPAGASDWQAFRSQSGEPAQVSASYESGATIFASNLPSPLATLTQWSREGAYLGEQTVDLSTGSLIAQDNDSILLRQPTVQGVRVAALAGAQVLWQREFLGNCNVIDFPKMALISCLDASQTLTTLIRVSRNDGQTLWERPITPLQLSEPFIARRAFLQANELQVLSWARSFGAWKFSAARLNANTGQLIAVAPNRITVTSQSLSLSFAAEDTLDFPFYDPWVHMRVGVLGEVFRFAVRIDALGRVSTNNLGINSSHNEHYADRISDNGVRWFAQTTTEDVRAIEARAYSDTRLVNALTLEHQIITSVPGSTNWGVKIRIRNDNPVEALDARITLPYLHCGNDIDPQTGTRLVSVQANSVLEFSCGAWFNSARREPEAFRVLLRQPFNFDPNPYFATTNIVLNDTFLRSGFDVSAGQ